MNTFQTKLMKPVLFLYLINGLPIRRKGIKQYLMIIQVLIFHLTWLLATVTNLWCLSDSFYSLHFFTIFAKIAALATWWDIHYKKKKMEDLIMLLNSIWKNLDLGASRSSRVLARTSPWMMVIITALPSILWVALKPQLTESCFLFWASIRPNFLFLIAYFFLLSLQQYVNWCLPYATGILYICVCRETSRIAKNLLKSLRTGKLDYDKVGRAYRLLLKVVVQLDSAMCLVVLLCLARCFMEFFRSLTMFFEYSRDLSKIKLVACASFYALESGFLYVAIVLFADKLQGDCNALRKSLLRHTEQKEKSVWKAVEKCSQLFEDKKDIKLTAWKMLRLQKRLLFTTVTSILTYSIILQQFHSTA